MFWPRLILKLRIAVTLAGLMVIGVQGRAADTKEIVVSHHVCVEGAGCSVQSQTSYFDAHMVLLTPGTRYHRHLQGNIVDLSTSCLPESSRGAAAENHNRNHGRRRRGYRPSRGKRRPSHYSGMVGLVRCGSCPLTSMLQSAIKENVGGAIVSDSGKCGLSAQAIIEMASTLGIPVGIVSDNIGKELVAIQGQDALMNKGHYGFVYISATDNGLPKIRHFIVRLLASTHILLVASLLLTIIVYLVLACTIGSLRHVPHNIAPRFFQSKHQTLDIEVVERLPIIPAQWDTVENSTEAAAAWTNPGSQLLLKQLIDIIQCNGSGPYSFTNDNTCAICLCNYLSHEPLRLLPCRHAFHRGCIDTWLLSKDMTVHCPVCKANIIDGLQALNKRGYSQVFDKLCKETAMLGGELDDGNGSFLGEEEKNPGQKQQQQELPRSCIFRAWYGLANLPNTIYNSTLEMLSSRRRPE